MRLVALVLRLVRLVTGRLVAPLARLVDRLRPEAPGTFRDHDRQRSVPYRLYEPRDTGGPAPVVLFSHGMGGSRDAAPYLGRALAAAGYWGVFLQHPGSDRGAFRAMRGAASQDEAMQRFRGAMLNPVHMRDRFRDIPFVLDRLARLNADPDSALAGRLDLERVGMAGHSYGARTVMAAAGQRLGGGGASFHEPRIRAGVLLSPSAARRPDRGDDLVRAADLAGVTIPLLHVTGTRDTSLRARTALFGRIPAPEQYLLVLDGAAHGDFSAAGHGGQPPRDTRVTRTVALAAVLFFDAYLKGDPAARAALREEFPAGLAPGDRFEAR